MADKLKITPSALRDLHSGIAWYNTKAKGLGGRFHKAIQNAFDRIAAEPQSASFLYNTVRYKPVETFPYIIVYEELEGGIVAVLRIFNTYLNPESI